MRYLSLLCFSLFSVFAFSQEPKLILPIGHTSGVTTAKFSPDGKRIVTTSYDNTAKLWDAVTGNLLLTLGGKDSPITSAQFTPRGMKIVTTGELDSIWRIWDANSGRILNEFQGNTLEFDDPFFTPDGEKIVTTSDEGVISLWSVQTGKRLISFSEHSSKVTPSQYSQNGNKIVTVSNNHVTVWDAVTGNMLFEITDRNLIEFPPQFTPDGSKILVVSFDSVKLYDAISGNIFLKFERAGRTHLTPLPIQTIKFSPDGKKIFIGSGLGEIWDAVNGKRLCSLNCFDYFNFSQFSLDGNKLLTTFTNNTNTDDTAKIWDARSGKLLIKLAGHTDEINSAEFSPDGNRVVTSSWDHSAIIWDANSGNKITQLKGHTSAATSVDFCENGNIVVANSGIATTWNALKLIPTAFCHIPVSPNGTYVKVEKNGKKLLSYGLLDSTVRIWDTESKKLLCIRAKTGNIVSAQLSPDGTRVFIGGLGKDDDAQPEIWNAVTGQFLTKLNGYFYHVYCGSFSPDSKKVVAGGYRRAAIFDAFTGQLLVDLDGHSDNVTSAIFSPDGNQVATASRDKAAKLWDAQTGKLLFNLEGHNTEIKTIEFSPDGKKIATTGQWWEIAKIWDVTTGKLLVELNDKWNSDAHLAEFDLTGSKILSTGNYENDANLWDVSSGNLVTKLNGHTHWITSSKFSLDGKTIATSSLDNTVKIWNAENGQLYCTFFLVDSTDYFAQTPSGYYQCSRNGAKLIHYVNKDLKVITFEQLDVKYNRPDLVLSAIGCKDSSLINFYKELYNKRIKKLGFDITLFKLYSNILNVPEVDFQNRDTIHYNRTSNRLALDIKAKDDSLILDRFNVWINEVPLFGLRGISLRNRNKKRFDTTITAILSDGFNQIETSVTNVNGLESYRIPLQVNYLSPKSLQDTVYFIGIGVGHFKDERMNLNYADKDIKALDSLFRSHFINYKSYVLLDSLVSTKAILALKDSLKKTSINDKVIVAVSGHGLIDDDSLDFYLATTDINFQKPQEKGIPYDNIESLFDDIPARKKLLLLDACHSGEIDKEHIRLINKIDKNQSFKDALDDAKKRSLQQQQGGGIGLQNSFEVMKELFADVSRSNGTVVISAARGNQLANEGDKWGNGAFTYAIKEGLLHTKADLNSDEKITVNELKDYVITSVSELTQGEQKPTTRKELIDIDWTIW